MGGGAVQTAAAATDDGHQQAHVQEEAADDQADDSADAAEAAAMDVSDADNTTANIQTTVQNGLVVEFKDLDNGPASATKVLTQQTQEIIVPSYAAWFSFGAIHDIERKALPEFFNNKNKSKTPQVYKDYRDFMINTNRLNPSEYLTVTACRRNLAGDVCAIIRVHAVLEQWGLINYQVNPDSRPSAVGPPFTGHFRVTAETPRGLQPLFPRVAVSKVANALPTHAMSARSAAAAAAATVPSSAPGAAPGSASKPAPTATAAANSSSTPPSCPWGLVKAPAALSKNIYQDSASTTSKKRPADDGRGGADAKRTKVVCGTCGVDCTKTRFHCTKNPSLDICPNCYLEGRFPSSLFSGDFLRLEESATNHDADAPWSDQETLLLLEGLELFDDNWLKIADHVGTRTRDQCILRFLQLPIEDALVGRTGDSLGPLQYARTPFSSADNPVLSLTAFLAAVVPPKVAAAAAEEAVRQLEADAFVKRHGGPSPPVNGTATTDAAVGDMGGNQLLERAGATALGAAAAKARAIADFDEREMQRATRHILELQVKKMELKLQHFNELEAILENERKDLERERQKLFLDRLALRRSVLANKEATIAAAAAASSATAHAAALHAAAGHKAAEEVAKAAAASVFEKAAPLAAPGPAASLSQLETSLVPGSGPVAADAAMMDAGARLESL
ncbi:SWIRM domain-containing protein [Entophlyctis helioformis]|nr:SWIRM domain-containing protein [Entophlyctis helioformis]